MERLGIAFEELGHNFYPVSTNGLGNSCFGEEKILKSTIALQDFGPGKEKIDIDLTYTIMANLPKRFLSNSKYKCCIYNYETQWWPKDWKKYYGLADFYFPSSNFSAEIFHLNGILKEKIFVIPHGIDTKVFNPNIPSIKINTEKKYKFVSVCAPHFRKNIDILLEAFCEAFTKQDDVCLVLKTKVFKHSDGIYDEIKNPKGRKGFEIVIGDIFKKLKDKHGDRIPEIVLLNGHVDNVASIYNACNTHITTTGAEGWCLPILESMASGLLNICPNYSGHLDFANVDNSLLINTHLAPAKQTEQYWGYNPKSTIGRPDKQHLTELMYKAVKEHNTLLEKFKPNMYKTVKELSWTSAAQKIIDATEGKLDHYKPKTYNWWPK